MPKKQIKGGALLKSDISFKLRADLNINKGPDYYVNKDKKLESIFIEILTKS